MGEFWRYLVFLTEIGFTIAISVIIGYIAGEYLDRRMGTSLIFTAIGAIIGVAAGFYSVYQLVKRGMDAER